MAATEPSQASDTQQPKLSQKGSQRWTAALEGVQHVVQQKQAAAAEAAARAAGEDAGSAPTKLAVFVRGARNLAAGHAGKCHPYVKVYCDGHKAKTDCISDDREPRWEQACILEVDSSRLQQLQLEVRIKHFRRWPLSKRVLGYLSLPLADVCANLEAYREPAWYPLLHAASPAQTTGAQVELQIFLSQERLAGPLSVLCATWNVGNEQPPPPEDLLQWLQGCDRQEHHLVAVSAQECNYVRSARRSTPRRLRLSSDKNTTMQRLTQDLSLESVDVRLAEDLAAAQEEREQRQQAAGQQQQWRRQLPFSRANGVIIEDSAEAHDQGCGTPQHPISSTQALASCSSMDASPFLTRQRSLLSQGSADFQKAPSFNARSTCSSGSMQSAASSSSMSHVPLASRSIKRRNLLVAQAQRVRDSYDSATAWEQHIAAALGPRYWLLSSRHMFQTRLLVFARQDVVSAVSAIRTGYEATGIGRVGVNKGGVAVGMQLGDTHLAFVGAHLAAHQSKTLARNADVAEIVHNMPPLGALRKGDLLTGFHHTFWMGDLNYRVEFGAQASSQEDSPSAADWSAMVDLVQQQQYGSLLVGDQLAREAAAGRVLLGFKEAPINFPPTFKVTKGDSSHAYSPKRSPAWCDRILYRSNLPHKQAQPQLYTSAPAIATSDHKPVLATFSVPIVEAPADSTSRSAPHHKQPSTIRLLVESIHLADQASWEACLGPAVAKAAARGGGRLKVQLRLSASCLLGRKDQMMAVDPHSLSPHLSNSSGRRRLTRHPLPLNLMGRHGSTLAGLEHDMLIVQLLAVEGWKRRVLASGVLPLQPAVAEYRAWMVAAPGTPRPSAELQVHMHSGSAYAGTLVVHLQLSTKGADRIAAGFLQHIISARRSTPPPLPSNAAEQQQQQQQQEVEQVAAPKGLQAQQDTAAATALERAKTMLLMGSALKNGQQQGSATDQGSRGQAMAADGDDDGQGDVARRVATSV